MLKNMKIRKSLIMGFGIAVLVPLIIIVVTLVMMSKQSASYQEIINKEMRSSQLITQCRMQANVGARSMREMILLPDRAQEKKEYAYNALRQLESDLAELDQIYPLKDNMLNTYKSTLNTWGTVLEQIIQEIESGNNTKAIELISTQCDPALDQLGQLAQEIKDNLNKVETEYVDGQALSTTITILVTIGVMLFLLIFIFMLGVKIIRNITLPSAQVREALIGFSQGNLEIDVEFESKNELGDMCNALRSSQGTLKAVIDDIVYLLGEMANGNFNVRTRAENSYVGDLQDVLKAIRGINRNLSDTLVQIAQSADQVSAGADQVSTGAQSLAQGATEQASAVEELSATINEISNNSQENVHSSEETLKNSLAAGEQVQKSTELMAEMVTSMKKISDSSEEIGKIIGTIENIAFQTNILALNAAVEAARAGTAGKGFAVVANEVRDLATKSDQAAKATKELIDRAINSVHEGNAIVKDVSDALTNVATLAGQAIQGTEQFIAAVKGEAESIAQVTEGIDQISSVVQTNSATSEQSAAASEQLSGQATLMKELMQRFKLRDDSGFGAAPSYGAAPALSAPQEESYENMNYSSSAFSKY